MSEAAPTPITLQVEAITEPVEVRPTVETTIAANPQQENKAAENSKKNSGGGGGRWNNKKQRYDGRSKRRRWDHDRRGADDDPKRVRTNPEDRVKRRKYVMLMGFAGANYCGMQRNPDVNTIEEELLKAMHKNKLIADDAFEVPQNIHFQRAARTDKGVSAARQCCSLKLREFLFCAVQHLWNFKRNHAKIWKNRHFSLKESKISRKNRQFFQEIDIFSEKSTFFSQKSVNFRKKS